MFTVAQRKDMKVSFLKRSTKYISVSIDDFNFRDIMLLSVPCTLSKYLKTWKVQGCKSVFPYEYFNSVEELEKYEEFPPFSAFYSNLKGDNISEEDYINAKALFYQNKSLPNNHENKMNNMKDWLIFYNKMDVLPFLDAIQNQFNAFYELFGQNLMDFLSLPGCAQKICYNFFDKQSPLICSFNKDIIRKDFRGQLYGGLSNVYHRYLNLRDDTGPLAGRFAPNGDKFSYFCFFDFNSLYLWCQSQPLPTTPGILWQKTHRQLRKSILSSQTSFQALQWLNYMQHYCKDLVDPTGNRVTIQQHYYRGEVTVGKYEIDGYAKVENQEIYFEFHGCR